MKYQYLKDVTTLQVFPEKCTGCGMCTQVCPREVFSLMDNRVSIVTKDNCIECGACAKNCPFNAIQVTTGVGCAIAVFTGMLKGNTSAEACT